MHVICTTKNEMLWIRRFSSTVKKTEALVDTSSLYYLVKKIGSVQSVRSTGPGGQKVNKSNSAVIIKLNLYDKNLQSLLPETAVKRLLNSENPNDSWRNKVTKVGELKVRAENERDQHINKEIAIEKMVSHLQNALIEPVEKKLWEPISEKGKVENKLNKKFRKDKKSNRSKPKF